MLIYYFTRRYQSLCFASRKGTMSPMQFEDVFFQQLLRFPDVTLNVTNLMGEQTIPWSLSLNISKCHKILPFQCSAVMLPETSTIRFHSRAHIHPTFDFWFYHTQQRFSKYRKSFLAPTKHVHMTRETKSNNIWIVILVALIKQKSTRLGNS